MKNGEKPAAPVVVPAAEKPEFYTCGLSKRETFAMAAMQGFCANSSTTESLLDEGGIPADKLARMAVVTADALLKALEE